MSSVGYSLGDRVPHTGPMRLLDDWVEVAADPVQARATVRCDGIFEGPGEHTLPSWVGPEYIAQAIAAWSGLRERQQGRPIRPRFLVGTRGFERSRERLPGACRLTVDAARVFESGDGMAVFDGSVAGEGVQQSARVQVYLPPALVQAVAGQHG
jgi:predicted hotdog family 3-hydroxylacyl-ACP dehydratase